MKYNFKIKDNHIVATIGDAEALIDTGAPISVGEKDLIIDTDTYTVKNTFQGITIEDLKKQAGINFNYLIGANILKNFVIKINWTNKTIDFLKDIEIVNSDNRQDINFFMDIPMIDISIDSNSTKAFFDTGAKLSYVPNSWINNLESIETVEDFYPGYGKFQTKIFELEIQISKEVMKLKFGNLPSQLQGLLNMAPAQVIIGNDIFKYYPEIVLNYIEKYIILIK